MTPRVAVLSTGTELLLGRSLDANLGHIARAIEPLGLEVGFHATCPDDPDRLVAEIRRMAGLAQAILLTGGLGPTEDDFTRRAAAEAFGRPLEFRPALWRSIRARFRAYRIRMAATNRRQAWLPSGATGLPNPHGSAPGFRLVSGDVRFYALPGPPREMLPMLRRHVLPDLKRAFPRRAKVFRWDGVVCGLPEGSVDEIVRRVVARHPGATYGITAGRGAVRLWVRREGRSAGGVGRDVRRALGPALLEGTTLAEDVARLLGRRRATIAVAESCTGGMICSKLVAVPGISRFLREGSVVYSDASKVARLGVPAAVLKRHGAVSAEAAAAMAEGAARAAGADVGVGVTGIAGPGGGRAGKPVGLVFFGVEYRGRTKVERRVFPGDRGEVRERASDFALNLVRRELLEGGAWNAVGSSGRATAAARRSSPARSRSRRSRPRS